MRFFSTHKRFRLKLKWLSHYKTDQYCMLTRSSQLLVGNYASKNISIFNLYIKDNKALFPIYLCRNEKREVSVYQITKHRHFSDNIIQFVYLFKHFLLTFLEQNYMCLRAQVLVGLINQNKTPLRVTMYMNDNTAGL